MAIVEIQAGSGTPIGVVGEARVEADNLFTVDPDFVAEAELLADEREIGRLCQSVFELGVKVSRFARDDGHTIVLAQQVERFQDKVQQATGQRPAGWWGFEGDSRCGSVAGPEFGGDRGVIFALGVELCH